MNKSCIGLISANYTIEGLSPLIKERAVSSVPFGGRYRLIDFPLSNLANAGISSVAIITPANNRSLVEHVGIGKEWGFGRKAGSLFLLPGTVYGARHRSSRFLLRDLIYNISFLTRKEEEYVIICGSNKIYNMDLSELIRHKEESPSKITLVYKKMLADNDSYNLYLDVEEEGSVSKISTKGKGVVNTFLDCAILERKFLLNVLEWYGVFEDMDLIELLGEQIDKVDVDAVEFNGYVGMFDNMEEYLTTSMDLLNPEIRDELFNPERQIYTNVQDTQPARYGKSAKVVNSLISGGCIIDGTVENSIVFRNSVIEKDAVVKNSIVMQKGVISMGAALNNVICDKSVLINEEVSLAGGTTRPFVVPKNSTL